jgi:hypothetical protein
MASTASGTTSSPSIRDPRPSFCGIGPPARLERIQNAAQNSTGDVRSPSSSVAIRHRSSQTPGAAPMVSPSFWSAGNGCVMTARLADHQETREAVPGVHGRLDVSADAAGGDAGQHVGPGPVAVVDAAGFHQAPDDVRDLARIAALGRADADEALVDAPVRAEMQARPVERDAMPGPRREMLAGHRHVDDPEDASRGPRQARSPRTSGEGPSGTAPCRRSGR